MQKNNEENDPYIAYIYSTVSQMITNIVGEFQTGDGRIAEVEAVKQYLR